MVSFYFDTRNDCVLHARFEEMPSGGSVLFCNKPKKKKSLCARILYVLTLSDWSCLFVFCGCEDTGDGRGIWESVVGNGKVAGPCGFAGIREQLTGFYVRSCRERILTQPPLGGFRRAAESLWGVPCRVGWGYKGGVPGLAVAKPGTLGF